jgi:phage terminase large subunit-like protein
MPRAEGSANNRAKRAERSDKGPWKSWPRKLSRWGRAIKFIESYAVIPKGVGSGKPMVLASWQKEHLEEVLADGITAAITSFPRGNGKSSLGAATAIWAVFDEDETGQPQVPIIATTVGQAIRSVYGVADRMVIKSPELQSRSIRFTGTGTTKIVCPWNGGELFPMANTVDGLQGLDPSLGIFDEIGFQPLESWDSLQLATGKRKRSLIWGMGTPGLTRTNALWLIRAAVAERGMPPGFVYREFAAEANCALDDREQWRLANPAIGAGFLQETALETALKLSPEAQFRVFRLGQWVEGLDSWLGDDGRAIWRALEDPYELVEGGASWIGVDVGLKRDSTAVCIVQRREDGRLHAKVRLWLPTKDEPVDVTDVMGHIRVLTKTFKVGAVAFDARFFDVPAKMLYDEGIAMVEVPQSPERMTPIIGGLYERIKSGSLSHDHDSGFETQVLNAVPRLQERGFTLAKAKSRGRIDACIALALAVDRADHQPKAKGSVWIL